MSPQFLKVKVYYRINGAELVSTLKYSHAKGNQESYKLKPVKTFYSFNQKHTYQKQQRLFEQPAVLKTVFEKYQICMLFQIGSVSHNTSLSCIR